MIKLGIDTIKYTWETVDQLKVWILYAVGSLFLLFFANNKMAKAYVKCGVIGTLIVFNPLFAGIVASSFLSMSRYFRLLWLIPIYLVIAIAAAELCAQKNKLFFFICSGLICVAGKWIYLNDFDVPENLYKLPQEAVDICEYFHETQEYQNGNLKISVDPELCSYIRQIDAAISLQYGREAGLYSSSQSGGMVYYQLNKDTMASTDIAVLADALKKDYCQYVVIKAGKADVSFMQENGCMYVGIINGYEIYKLS